MTKCWQHDFRARPTAQQVASDSDLIARDISSVPYTPPSSGGETSSRYPSDTDTSDSSQSTVRPFPLPPRSQTVSMPPATPLNPMRPPLTPIPPSVPAPQRIPTPRPSSPRPPPSGTITPQSPPKQSQPTSKSYLLPKPQISSRTKQSTPAPASRRFPSNAQQPVSRPVEPVSPGRSTPKPILRPPRSNPYEGAAAPQSGAAQRAASDSL